jgi:uncharacterized protein
VLFIKTLYIVLGYVSLVLGLAGIVLPGLPTTPFLLLTAWLFLKGSPKLHEWMVKHRHFGPILKEFHTGKGLYLYVKFWSLLVMIASVSFSCVFLLNAWWMRIVAIVCMLPGIYVLFFVLPTRKKDPKVEQLP